MEEIKRFGIAVTLREAADILGINYNTLKVYVVRKQIPVEHLRKSGNTWLISIKYLEKRFTLINIKSNKLKEYNFKPNK